MKHFITSLFLLLFSLSSLYSSPAAYHDTNNSMMSLTQEEMQWIKDHPIIKVGGGPDWAPFDFVGDDQTYQGIANDYLQLISQKTGLQFKVIVDKWANNLQKTKENKLDLLHAIYYTDERANYLEYTDAYFNMLDYFFIRNDLKVTTLKDLDGKRVAIPKGYAHEEILKKEFPLLKIVTVDTFSQAIEAVLENRADVLFDTYAAISFTLKRDAISSIVPFKAYRGKHLVKLHMATQKGNTTLTHIINKALAHIHKEEKSHIYEKWLTEKMPQPQSTLFTEKEQVWLNQNLMIKIAIMDFWATDDKGDSIHTNLIKLLNKYGDLHLIPVKFHSWKEGFEEVLSGNNIHGIANLSWSKERKKHILYTPAYNYIPNNLIIKKDDYTIPSFGDLENKTIALTSNSITNTVIKEQSKNIKILITDTDEEMYHKLASDDEIIAAFTYSPNHKMLTKYHLKIAKKIFGKYSEVSLGISQKYPLLQSIINKVYSVIPKDKLTNLQTKIYTNHKTNFFPLTQEEQTWVKQHPTITVGVEAYWPPIDFVNEKNTSVGIAQEYLKLISEKTNLTFKKIPNEWTISLKNFKKREVDLLSAVYLTPKRTAYMHFSDPYFELLSYFFIRDDLKVKTLKDLDGKRVAIAEDNGLTQVLKERFPKIKIIMTPTLPDAIDAVLQNRADILFENIATISYVLKKESISTIIPFKPYRKKSSTLHFSAQKENKPLINIINKAIKSITPEEKNAIFQKWIFDQQHFQNTHIKLTKKEESWLIQNPHITFAGDPNWLPFEAFDENGQYQGIVADYLKKIEDILPLTFQPQQVSTWQETLALAKDGKIDVISDVMDSEGMQKNYTPIKSYLSTPIVIIMRDSHDFVDDIKDIYDKKIAIIDGYGYIGNLKKAYPTQKFISVKNAEIALEKLSRGKIDAAVLSMPKAGYLIRTKGYSHLKIVGKTSVNMHLTLFVLNSKPKLHSILERAMGSFSITEHTSLIKEWQNIKFAKETDYMLLYQIAGFLGIILLWILYWNRTLSKEIDEREKVEAALLSSEQQMRALLDNIPLQVLVTDYTGKVYLANPFTFQYYGFDAKDLENANVLNFYADPHEREEILLDLTNKGSIHNKIVKFIHPDKSIKKMMISILPITYDKEPRLLSIAVDLTERLEIEKELSQAKEDADKANLAKSEFLANMSHEIRTPMNSVIGFSELLSKQITDPVQKDYLDSIMRGGNALLEIINDILDLSKIEAGKLEIISESVDIEKLSKEMETLFSVKLIQKNLYLKLDIDKNLPKYLLLDGTRIRQILFNLLGNAIKFTDKGGVSLQIMQTNDHHEKSKIDLNISVKDTGIGISKAYLPYLFDAFGQQSGQNAQKYGGTGLGLSICHKLVSAMHGTIHVESTLKKGSTFSITLPDIPVSSMEELHNDDTYLPEDILFENATIMIVDDILDNRKLVSATLEHYHFNIIEAIHGADALEKLATIKVDLIFMDIKMPIMDGYEATKNIKENPSYKNIPVIALTASVMGKDLEKIQQYNFDGYLRKPVSQQDLLSQLSKFIAYKSIIPKNDTSPDTPQPLSESLPELIDALEHTYTERWQDIKDKGDFSLIEDFATSLQELAKKHQVNQLETYASQLLHNCKSFDIDQIDFNLNSYPNLIKIFKELQV